MVVRKTVVSFRLLSFGVARGVISPDIVIGNQCEQPLTRILC
jgi:hypothetical protein